MGDVWDIGVIAPVARERTGYPSQKPETLLARIVAALSAPGDLVLDPYAGSGTTLAVAAKMGRRFVGIDASDVSIQTISKRPIAGDEWRRWATAGSRATRGRTTSSLARGARGARPSLPNRGPSA